MMDEGEFEKNIALLLDGTDDYAEAIKLIKRNSYVKKLMAILYSHSTHEAAVHRKTTIGILRRQLNKSYAAVDNWITVLAALNIFKRELGKITVHKSGTFTKTIKDAMMGDLKNE